MHIRFFNCCFQLNETSFHGKSSWGDDDGEEEGENEIDSSIVIRGADLSKLANNKGVEGEKVYNEKILQQHSENVILNTDEHYIVSLKVFSLWFMTLCEEIGRVHGCESIDQIPPSLDLQYELSASDIGDEQGGGDDEYVGYNRTNSVFSLEHSISMDSNADSGDESDDVHVINENTNKGGVIINFPSFHIA